MNPRTRRIRKQHAAIRRSLRVPRCAVGMVPQPCDPRIHSDGTLMFQTHSIGRMWDIEAWVQRIAKTSGQPVDWHFAGGRVMVLALGDLAKVRAAIRKLMPEHDALYAKDNAAFSMVGTLHPPRPAWWTNEDEREHDTAPRAFTAPDGNIVLFDPLAAAIIQSVTR